MSREPTYEELEKRILELEQAELERKRMEQALRESTERYRRIFESLQDVYYEAGMDGTILEISPSIEKLSQYMRKELIGKSLYDIYSDSRERKEFLKIVLNKGKVNDYEIHLRDKDGSQRACSITVLLMRDSQGTPVKLIGSMRDISEKKRTEEALRESEERFRLAFHTSPDSINLNRLEDGVYIDINEGFTKIMGYTRDDVIGKSSLALNIWKNPEDRERLVDGLTKTGYVENLEAPFTRKDGKIRYGLMSSSITRISGENVIISITRDITDRRHAEEALRKSEATLESIFEVSPLGIGLFRNREMHWHNQTMARMLGYSSEEIYGKNAGMIYQNDEEYERAERAINTLGPGKRVADIETQWVRKDGSAFDCHIRYTLLDPESEESDVLAIAEDITERKKAEEEKKKLEKKLRQAQKMEAIGTLAGGIAHDFNNILGAIIGLSELAMMEAEEDSSLHRHIERILASGMRAKDLVKQILAFSRQRENEDIVFSIKPVVKEALKLLRSSLPTSLEIKSFIETDPGLIKGDPTQIHQVLMNLCTNAEHAMREKGGVLEVKLGRVDVDEAMAALHHELNPGPYVRLEVKDTGYGMDPETMDRIFDPYFTTKGVGEGTGLGLAVVQGIVQKHGGAVTVKSKVGKGSTFEVYFPIIEGEKGEIQGREKVESVLPTGNERILFIDDEEMLAEVGKRILERLGYDVTTRTSSLEALELFKAKPGYFDLVITDMSMPNMTGEQLSKEVMKIRQDIPIILCTGFSHIIAKEKAREIGIRAFAMKPLVTKDLAETVRKVLDDNDLG